MKNWLETFIANRPLLFRIVGRIARPDDIEDIVQETFLHSYAAARKQEVENPRAFMATVARNIALNHVGRASARLNVSIEDVAAVDPDFEESSLSLEHEHQSEDRFLVFCRAVAELPTNCRKVFVLKKVYGLSQKEIAEYLDLSQSTVEKHVAKGLFLTSQYMSKYDYLSEDRNTNNAKSQES